MHLYGLIIGIAILVGINYFEKHQTFIPKNKLLIFEIGVIFSALIGARLYHVLDYWTYYSQLPVEILYTWNGGLGIYGALLGGFSFIFIFIRNLKLEIRNLLDSITPTLPLCQAIGRLGNFFNNENPIWWLEAALNLILFFVITKAKNLYSPTGFYLTGYGIIRLLTEFWRSDTWTQNGIKIAQVISLIIIGIGLILIANERTKISQKHH